MKKLLVIILLTITTTVYSQNKFEVSVIDSASNEAMVGATVVLKGTTNGASADVNGAVSLSDIPDGEQTFIITFIGYQAKEISVTYPRKSSASFVVMLVAAEALLDEIVIEATRANRTVANTPTRIEVLTDEIDEAASMEPSKISHLITHSTGIQVQTTSASSNGAVIRIQGLNGRYTQLLKDGFPLYGGFSGSLDVLQIPPLDLKQVEYIKGSASTLYGGGAIGGLINLVTKKPGDDETLLHINLSHIGSKDFNAFTSKRFGKFGITNLATLHLHSPYDADKDNFSDVPEVAKFNFNPKLFYYPDEKSNIYFGATLSKESRMGGDMDLINNQTPDSINFYFDKQRSNRITTQFSADRSFTKASTLTLKNSMSSFDRLIQIRENVVGQTTQFAGTQINTFSELNYNLNKEKYNLSLGLNLYSDNFTEQLLDTNTARDQEYLTYGIFANHLWDMTKKFAIETGIRTDYVQAKSKLGDNSGEAFFLPRISLLHKTSRSVTLRLGGGMGYRMPTIFNEEAEPYGYKDIQPIDFSSVEAERSYGGNFDFKYQSTFGSENILFTFNQLFFYNVIRNPIELRRHTDDGHVHSIGHYDSGNLGYYNTVFNLNSQGFESQLKVTIYKFTWFVGYTYTDAFFKRSSTQKALTLTPQHSIKGDLLFVEDNKWRIGWDYEYKSEQLLSSGLKSRALFSTGIIVERTIKNFVIFLNAENFTDTRQTKYESLASGPNNTPQFTEVWAPLDGYFFNAGLKIKL